MTDSLPPATEGDLAHDVQGATPVDGTRKRERVTRGIAIGACFLVCGAIAVPTVGATLADEEPAQAALAVSAVNDQSGPMIQLLPRPATRAAGDAAKAKPAPARPAGVVPDVVSQVISQSEVLNLVRANFPANEVGNAMAVASCESGQQSIVGSTNGDGTTDWGVFQLNDGGTLQGAMSEIGVPVNDIKGAQLAALDAGTNVRAAAAIFARRGWSPWVCAYKQQIVAELYSNERGPMYGRFTVVGASLPPLMTAQQAALKARESLAAAAAMRRAAQAKAQAAREAAARREAAQKRPQPKPKPSPTKKPAPSPTKKPAPSPTKKPQPSPTEVSTAPPPQSSPQGQSPQDS